MSRLPRPVRSFRRWSPRSSLAPGPSRPCLPSRLPSRPVPCRSLRHRYRFPPRASRWCSRHLRVLPVSSHCQVRQPPDRPSGCHSRHRRSRLWRRQSVSGLPRPARSSRQSLPKSSLAPALLHSYSPSRLPSKPVPCRSLRRRLRWPPRTSRWCSRHRQASPTPSPFPATQRSDRPSECRSRHRGS